MQSCRIVALDEKAPAAGFAFDRFPRSRLRSLAEVALTGVFLQRHNMVEMLALPCYSSIMVSYGDSHPERSFDVRFNVISRSLCHSGAEAEHQLQPAAQGRQLPHQTGH